MNPCLSLATRIPKFIAKSAYQLVRKALTQAVEPIVVLGAIAIFGPSDPDLPGALETELERQPVSQQRGLCQQEANEIFWRQHKA